MGNLSFILIFVVVCLLGTASTLNTTKTIDFYSPAATGVESRQFFNRNLQLHFPNMIDQLIMFFTRLFEIFGGSTETATAITTTTTTTTTTTQKLTCALLGGMTCDAIDTSPDCITVADAQPEAASSTWPATCAQTGSGMGVVHTETTPATTVPADAVLLCYFGVTALVDGEVIVINLDGTNCKKITVADPPTAEAVLCNDAPASFVCSVAVPP